MQEDWQQYDEKNDDEESVYDEFAEITFRHTPWLQKCWDITGHLWYHEEATDFLEPVTRKVLGRLFDQYLRTIEYPMDLTTIKEKIKRGSYPSASWWRKDVETMFNNCIKFNEEGSEIHKTAVRLRDFYFYRLRQEGLADDYGAKIRIR